MEKIYFRFKLLLDDIVQQQQQEKKKREIATRDQIQFRCLYSAMIKEKSKMKQLEPSSCVVSVGNIRFFSYLKKKNKQNADTVHKKWMHRILKVLIPRLFLPFQPAFLHFI